MVKNGWNGFPKHNLNGPNVIQVVGEPIEFERHDDAVNIILSLQVREDTNEKETKSLVAPHTYFMLSCGA